MCSWEYCGCIKSYFLALDISSFSLCILVDCLSVSDLYLEHWFKILYIHNNLLLFVLNVFEWNLVKLLPFWWLNIVVMPVERAVVFLLTWCWFEHLNGNINLNAFYHPWVFCCQTVAECPWCHLNNVVSSYGQNPGCSAMNGIMQLSEKVDAWEQQIQGTYQFTCCRFTECVFVTHNNCMWPNVLLVY